MSEKEPGQRAWEVWATIFGPLDPKDWRIKGELYRSAWAAVDAAIRQDQREKYARLADAEAEKYFMRWYGQGERRVHNKHIAKALKCLAAAIRQGGKDPGIRMEDKPEDGR